MDVVANLTLKPGPNAILTLTVTLLTMLTLLYNWELTLNQKPSHMMPSTECK